MRYRPRLFNADSVALIVAGAMLMALALGYLTAPFWEPAVYMVLP